MLVSCGGRNRSTGDNVKRRRKIPRLGGEEEDPSLDASCWEYVAEGGANVVFRYTDDSNNERILRVPKFDHWTSQEELFGFIQGSVLPIMNHRDIFAQTKDYSYCDDENGEYHCTKSNDGNQHQRYRLYGKLVKPSTTNFLHELNKKLCSSKRPEHRRGSTLITSESLPPEEPTRLMLLPNVVSFGDVCIELKPKSSLGPHNTIHPQRLDGMAMKQRTCRYCMHQEFKVHKGKISKRRPAEKAYCPMDLFSNNKERMKQAILALLSDPQNNCKIFAPNGKDITTEVVASTKPTAANSFQDLTGMERDELVDVMVEGLWESCVLDDLHRAHELDELDIEGIWRLHQLMESSSDCHGHTGMIERQQQQQQLDPKTRRLLSEMGCTEESNWEDIRKGYRRALEKFFLATTMKDCSILLSIRCKQSSREENQHDEKWSSMEYRIDWNGRVYSVVISIIDLDIKSKNSLSKYYNLDQEILHHYSEICGLHKKFCFGQFLSETNDSQSQPHADMDSVVQIKGNMMCRLLYPNPVCLLTVYDPTRHEANVMTITWLTAIDNHGTFVCSISKRRHTAELLRVSSVFVLNIPTRDLEDTILTIGSCSGRERDKFRELGLRTCVPGWFFGMNNNKKRTDKNDKYTKHAIALRDCIAHTVCLVQQKQDMGQHWLLVCKQQLAWSQKAYFADGKRFVPSSESLPPYLTFLGTKTFGSVVSNESNSSHEGNIT